MRVALFVTCLVDFFRPTVGFAAVKLLEEAGCTVEVPRGPDLLRPAGLQFGRPRRREGDRPAGARRLRGLRLCRRAVRLMRRDDPRSLSRNSSPMIRRSCRGRSISPSAAGSSSPSLSTSAGCRRSRHGGNARVTYHDGCSGLRELGVKDQPRRLLASVGGLSLTELPGAEVCCGFGGTFCIKYPDISDKMVSDKEADIAATGAEAVLAGDLGCLLNIAGKLHRRGRRVEVRHVAEVLAGMTEDVPPIGAAAIAAMLATSRSLRGERPRRPRQRQSAAGAGADAHRVSRSAAASRSSASRSSRLCARSGRSIKDHTLEHLDFYLELYEANVTRLGRPGSLGAQQPDEARAAVLEICRSVDAKIVTKGKSMIAEEVGLNEHLEENGITPVETDLGEYIIQLRHEPPSHLIAPAIHLMKEQVADTFRAAHRDARSGSGSLGEARQLLRRGARRAAAAVSRRRCRHHRRQLPGRRDRLQHHRHQRGQRRSDADPAARPHRDRRASRSSCRPWRTRRPCCACLARSATGQEFSSYTTMSTGPRAAGAISTGPSNITSCCSTMAAARCSAASSRTCCAASAAPPA